MIFRAGDIFNGHNLVYSGYGFTKLPGMMHRVMLLTGSDSQYEVKDSDAGEGLGLLSG